MKKRVKCLYDYDFFLISKKLVVDRVFVLKYVLKILLFGIVNKKVLFKKVFDLKLKYYIL